MHLINWSRQRFPVIGMLHAPPLPGSPLYGGSIDSICEQIQTDAKALVDGGVDGLMLENFGDSPFYPERVPAVTIAAMAMLAREITSGFDIPLGINVLRNDGRSALAVALACGASFIRVNVLCGARVTDQGLIQGIAHDLLRDRTNLGAQSIEIWADVDVKHSAPLATRPLNIEVYDLIQRGKADAVVVSGSATAHPVDLETLRTVKVAAGSTPVMIGSGATTDSIRQLAPFSNGAIVGSSFKRDGHPSNPVESDRVRHFMGCLRDALL